MSQNPFTPPAPPGRGHRQHEQQDDPRTPSTALGFTPHCNGSGRTPSTPNTDSRPKLDEAERKTRHSESETKRRNKIRNAFERLSNNLPGMAGQAASEALVLDAAVKEIRRQQAIRRALKRKVIDEGLMDAQQFEELWNAGAQEATGPEQVGEYEDPADDDTPNVGIKRERGG